MSDLDWSDLSKLQTRDGCEVVATYPGVNDTMIVVCKHMLVDKYFDANVYISSGRGNMRDGPDRPRDIIPRPPQPKKVTLWRPEWEAAKGAKNVSFFNTGLYWFSKEYWNGEVEKRPGIYGPLESREFEVPG